MKTRDCTIYIVRHGESQVNADFGSNLDFASLDSDLTKQGEQQIRNLSQKLRQHHFDAIFASSLLRAKRSAEIIAKERNLEVITRKALEERRLGNLTSKSQLKLEKALGKLYEKSNSLIDEEIWKIKLSPDMESEREALKRFITILREIAVAYPRRSVLVITHNIIMRDFLIHLGYASFKELPYGSIINGGYIKIETDGIDFFIKETYGINKKA